MSTTISLTEELAQKQLRYNQLNAQIASAMASAADWTADANDDKIRKTQPGKRTDEADKQRKLDLAANYRSSVENMKAEQALLEKDMNSLRSSIEAQADQGKILAQQGISQSAEETKANATAEAIKEQARVTSEAQAKAIATKSDSDAQNQKMKQLAIYIVLAILFIILAVVIYKKVRKIKK